MARVLEIVLDFSLQDWQATRGARVRAARDLGAELARAWRICPPVKMRRGHERVTIEPCRFVEAQPNDGGRWQTWIETTAQARRVLAACGDVRERRVELRQMRVVGLRIDLPDERPARPLRADERILAAHEVRVARPQQPVVVGLREEGETGCD